MFPKNSFSGKGKIINKRTEKERLNLLFQRIDQLKLNPFLFVKEYRIFRRIKKVVGKTAATIVLSERNKVIKFIRIKIIKFLKRTLYVKEMILGEN